MPDKPISLRRIDHVRFFVGNARQSAYFYRNAFGFEVIAYAGLETHQKHEAGYVLRQGTITLVLESPLSPAHPQSQRLLKPFISERGRSSQRSNPIPRSRP